MSPSSSSGTPIEEAREPAAKSRERVTEYRDFSMARGSPGTRLRPLLRRINAYVMRWAGCKYERLRSYKKRKKWWAGLIEREPGLFTHWAWVRSY
jgi:transposase InsO family protein